MPSSNLITSDNDQTLQVLFLKQILPQNNFVCYVLENYTYKILRPDFLISSLVLQKTISHYFAEAKAFDM